jgi:hypothetical protein
VWAVWTNPNTWAGGVISAAKIDGVFAIGAKITVRVKGYTPLTSEITRIEPSPGSRPGYWAVGSPRPSQRQRRTLHTWPRLQTIPAG